MSTTSNLLLKPHGIPRVKPKKNNIKIIKPDWGPTMAASSETGDNKKKKNLNLGPDQIPTPRF
jgi:hypothetical protein